MDDATILTELVSVLKERGRLWFPATGFSMGKKFQEADTLEIETVEASDLKRFDVVVFNRGDVWVAHRIIAIVDEGFQTMGDAMWHFDPHPVSPEQVVGRVTALRYGDHELALTNGLSFSEWAKYLLKVLGNLGR